LPLLKKYRYLTAAAAFGILSIIITFVDRDYSERWWELNLWLLSLALACLGLAGPLRLERLKITGFTRRELLALLVLAAIAVTSRFLFLDIYPFAPINDGFRDAGLEAARISSGENPTIFDYDYDDAHNFIIPALISFFYRISSPGSLSITAPITKNSFARQTAAPSRFTSPRRES
jgi:hypothetical protein